MKSLFQSTLAFAYILSAGGGAVAATSPSETAIQTKEIVYESGGHKFKGYLASPAAEKTSTDAKAAKHPGVLVIHEWWGQNAYARHRADMLAKLGYVAFALDMYGEDKTASDPKMAGMLMQEATASGEIPARFKAALEILKSQPDVDSTRIAAIGYCFGGSVVLQMARAGIPLKGVVAFHASMPPKADIKPGSIAAKVLVLHGGADQFSSPQAIAQFKKEMDDAKSDYIFIVYPGAKHGFTDPDATARGSMHHIPTAYDPSADQKSWAEMQKFFKKIF